MWIIWMTLQGFSCPISLLGPSNPTHPLEFFFFFMKVMQYFLFFFYLLKRVLIYNRPKCKKRTTKRSCNCSGLFWEFRLEILMGEPVRNPSKLDRPWGRSISLLLKRWFGWDRKRNNSITITIYLVLHDT